jgi:hypothetical protein
VHLGYHVLAIDHDHGVPRSPQSHVQDGTILGHVDVIASEHGRDPLGQAGALRQRSQEPERLVGHEVLRVVQVQVADLQGHALAAVRVSGEQPAQVRAAERFPVGLQGVPFGALFDQHRPHSAGAFSR